MYGEDEEKMLVPLPSLVSLRLRRLPELLYPERGLRLLRDARPSRRRGLGRGLPTSDSGEVGV